MMKFLKNLGIGATTLGAIGLSVATFAPGVFSASLETLNLNTRIDRFNLDPTKEKDFNGNVDLQTSFLKNAQYDVVSGDTLTTSDEDVLAIDSSSSSTTVTLASADATEGNVIVIEDTAGNAGANNITVDTEGSENIEGSSSITISSNYGGRTLLSDGSNWFVLE